MDCRNWKKVLILRDSGCLGDEVVFSSVYRELKKVNPRLNISVFAFGNAAVLLRENKYVDKLYTAGFRDLVWHQRWPTIIYLGLKLAVHKYDAVVDIREWKQKNWALLRLLASRFKYRAPGVFARRQKHFVQNVEDFLKSLGAAQPDTAYDLPLLPQAREKVARLTGDAPYIVLNPFGASQSRIFSDETLDLFISAVAKADARQIIVPYIQPPPGGGRKKTKHLRWRRTPQISGGNVKLFATQTPFDLIALIHKSDLLISPDTAAVHIAAAWRKKTIAFYNHPQVPVWLPNNPAAAIIKTAPEDINKFDFKEFERVYKQML